MTKTKLLICPYCGDAQPHADRCRVCGGLFESLSRRASHNAMGPWFVRDETRPHQPGFSYETLVRLIERGTITKYSIVRGPTTRQFWNVARRVPGAAHLLAHCHACDGPVDPDDHGCAHCGAVFGAFLDRNFLGLPEVRAMPDDVDAADDSDHAVSEERVTLEPYDRATGRERLSSFASNRELFEAPRAGAAGAVGAAVGNGSGNGSRSGNGRDGDAGAAESSDHAAPVASEPGAASMPSVETVLVHPTVRAMQRRIAQQHRTVRALAVLLTVAIIALIVVTAIVFRAGSAPVALGPESASIAPARGTAAASAARDGAEPGRDAAVREPDTGTSPGDEAEFTGAATRADDAARADALERYATAQVLFEAALDPERSVAERLRDAESALALLGGIGDALSTSGEEPNLQAEIARMEEETERLRLRGFFGE